MIDVLNTPHTSTHARATSTSTIDTRCPLPDTRCPLPVASLCCVRLRAPGRR
jgi:hypothetical protein